MLHLTSMKQEKNKELQNFAQSSSTKRLIEQHIRRKDPKAFTDEGIIKNYEIDYSKPLKLDPMGGFSITTYMNNDKEQYISFLFMEYNGVIDFNGTATSLKLNDMLEGH